MRVRWALALALWCLAPIAIAQPTPDTFENPVTPTRSGREIYDSFHAGLAEPTCAQDTSPRWRRHYAAAPKRLASSSDDVLSLFGYVVDALRAADLPTEYALIPFVESGYKPGARSPGGPVGMWQFIAVTARNHKVPIRAGYDGRLSPVDSTRAAVRYLKTLHGMFAGDWRLAVMAYNAGEYRMFSALKRSGQLASDADPENLVGVSGITRAYVRKLHALSCLLDQADDDEGWMRQLDRQVPRLAAVQLPEDTSSLDAWAKRNAIDPGLVRRLNPAFPGGRIARAGKARSILVPETAVSADATASAAGSDAGASIALPVSTQATPGQTNTHTVSRGESAWTIARRYGLRTSQLLLRNGLTTHSVLQPGMVLKLDPAAP